MSRSRKAPEPAAVQAPACAPETPSVPLIEDGWSDLDPAPDAPETPAADPWWEVTAPEHGLPRREIQAPTAEVAKERYLISLNLRTVKPTIKRVQ